jgi:uncharacterized membrane protein
MVPERTEVTAQGVNGAGAIVGWARLSPSEEDASQPPPPPFPTFGSHAYFWSETAGFALLPGFPGESQSEAVGSDLNDRRDVVGSAIPPAGDAINAVAWPRGGAIVSLNGADVNPSVALAVNNAGIAAGWTSADGESMNRATVWNLERATPITARIGGGIVRPGRAAGLMRGAARCLEPSARIVSKAMLAECFEGRER